MGLYIFEFITNLLGLWMLLLKLNMMQLFLNFLYKKYSHLCEFVESSAYIECVPRGGSRGNRNPHRFSRSIPR